VNGSQVDFPDEMTKDLSEPMPLLNQDSDYKRVLESSRVVAVLGAHSERRRPAFYVPDYLHDQGYRIIPVNPTLAGLRLWDEVFRETLAEIDEPVDIVDVFRRSTWLPQHLDDILAMTPLPKVVWLQEGVRNDAFANALVEAGMDVVQDKCTLAEHKTLVVR
jgi:predicted CoA-binding protein